jgi:hypothetical protein
MWEDHIKIYLREKMWNLCLIQVTMDFVNMIMSWTAISYRQKTLCQELHWLLPLVHTWPSICVTESARSRSIARATNGGEVPNKYYVVLNSDLVKVRYLLVYNRNLPQAR